MNTSDRPAFSNSRRGGILGSFLGFYRSLLPRDDIFVRLFAAHAAKGEEASKVFTLVLGGQENAAFHHEYVRRIEQEADVLGRETTDAVNTVFMPPFDASDILKLSEGLDDIVDLMKRASKEYILCGLPATVEMLGIAGCIEEACGELARGIPLLSNIPANAEALNSMCSRIDAIESRADEFHQHGLSLLFKPGVTRDLNTILLRGILDFIEAVIDRCEDVAKMVQVIVVKQV